MAGDDGVGHGSRAGMEGAVQAEHARGLHMGVYFRGHDVAVSEQNLDRAQVGAAFEQMGGEGMAQGVGGNRACDACLERVAPDQFPHALPAQGAARAVQENRAAFGTEEGPPVSDIIQSTPPESGAAATPEPVPAAVGPSANDPLPM